VELFMVPIECPERYEREINFWNCLPSGIDYSSLRDLAVNTCYKIRLQESQFLAEPQRLASLELSQLKETYVSVSKSFLAKRSGTLHGVGGWCRAGLSENAILTTEPAARNTDWAQIFFPVSEPVSVHAGDRLSCSIDTNDGYTWRWQVEISAEDAEGKLVRRRFEHSTFLSHPFSEATLRHRRVDAVPRLSKKGEAALFLLGLCDGRRTIGEMQEAVAARYGECWVSHADIVAFVAGVLAQ
jgi:hypothetical protein